MKRLNFKIIYRFALCYGVLIAIAWIASAHFLPIPLLDNEADTLPSARQFFSHGWLPTDWYLNLSFNYRFLFDFLVGPWLVIAPWRWVVLIGRFVAYCLFGLVAQGIGRSLQIRARYLIPALTMFLFAQSIVAGEWMVGGLETKCFAYVAILGSLIFYFERKFIYAFLCGGLAFSFHPLVGGYGAICFVVAALIGSDRADQLTCLKASWAFIPTALPGLFSSCHYLWNCRLPDMSHAALITVHYRLPHHLLPMFWSGHVWIIKLGLWMGLMGVAYKSSKNSKITFLSLYGLTSAFLFIVGLVIAQTHHDALLKYYWFRFADTMLPCLGAFILAYGLKEWAERSVVAKQFLPSLFQWIALGCLLAVVPPIFGVSGEPELRDRTESAVLSQNQDMADMLHWIHERVPKDETFLVSPFLTSFYLTAERAQFVSFKCFPQGSAEIEEWYKRICLCNRGQAPRLIGFRSRWEIENNFYRLSESELKALADHYALRYYLGRAGTHPMLPCVYANGTWALYRLDFP
jgi:hypothetical protein